MSVFSLFEQVLGHSRKRSVDIRAPKSYERKHCKSCDWYSQAQPMCNRHNRSAKPLDTACSKYLKRHRRGE